MPDPDNPYATPRSDHPAHGEAQADLVVLRAYPSATIAELDRGLLAEHGIAAVIVGGDVPALMSGVQSALLVHRDDHALALSALAVAIDDAEGDDEPAPCCPFCASPRIATVRPYALAIFIPFLWPLMLIQRQACSACKRQWK